MEPEQICAVDFPSNHPLGQSGHFEYGKGIMCNFNQNLSDQALVARVYDALLGRQPEPATLRQYHVFVTLLYLFLTFNLCRVLRLVNHNLVPYKLRPLIGDVISTFQTIACGFENGFVRKVYGMGAYCVQTFFLGLWSTCTFGQDTSGNPVTNFKHFFTRRYGFSRTIIHMTAQMLSGIIAHRYASNFWRLELSPEHAWQLANDQDCVTDLNVPVFLGFFIELSATVIDTVVSRTTTKKFMFERYEQFAKGLFSIWMTLMGLNLTGLYINPSNATARNFGCAGVTKAEFIFVYWLGPIFGAAIGLIVHQNFRSALHAMTSQFHDSTDQSATTKTERCHGDDDSGLGDSMTSSGENSCNGHQTELCQEDKKNK